MTNAYAISSTVGNHIAEKVSSYDSEGLITGVTYNPYSDAFLLCGYNSILSPFLVYIDHNRPPTLDVFGGETTKIDLVDALYLEQGSQIEGITFFEDSRYYISREHFSTSVGNVTVEFTQKLYEFQNHLDYLLSSNDYELPNLIQIVPNPIEDSLEIVQQNNSQKIMSVSLFSIHGKELFSLKQENKMTFKNLSKGIYLLKIEFKTGKILLKKIIKK